MMIELQNVSKIYEGSDYKTVALDAVTLRVAAGDFLAVMGPSGSGKTTFLNIIGCLDCRTSGTYLLDGEDVSDVSSARLVQLRKKYISFVFQNFALMQDYTIYENVEVPLLARNIKKRARREKIEEQLEALHIADLGKKLPSQLSGGQQQRAAIARALVADCPILLADEPTGALDQGTGRQLMELLSECNQNGKTIILITHDAAVASYAKRQARIVDGKLTELTGESSG